MPHDPNFGLRGHTDSEHDLGYARGFLAGLEEAEMSVYADNDNGRRREVDWTRIKCLAVTLTVWSAFIGAFAMVTIVTVGSL